jgi:nitrogen fixation NifU-like protein
MDELQELYQELIVDHNRTPRNFGRCAHTTHTADGKNPLCGDHIEVFVEKENGVLKEVMFEGAGCAIAKASASIMTTIAKGKTEEEVEELFHLFQEVVTTKPEDPLPESEKLGKLIAFAGVRVFPARVKCASLAWHTLYAAIKNTSSATTE